MNIHDYLSVLTDKQKKWEDERNAHHLAVQNDPTKGLQNGRCNRTDCQTDLPATELHLYNMNNAHYCVQCAHEIALACRNDGFKLFSFMAEEKKDL